jgi:hypothetical protein
MKTKSKRRRPLSRRLDSMVGGIVRQELNAGTVVQINGMPFRLVNPTIIEGHSENLCAAGLRLHDVPAKNRQNWAKTRTANAKLTDRRTKPEEGSVHVMEL